MLNQLKKKFQNKKILIVGLGLQGGGVGLIRFFLSLGGKVIVTDKKNKKELKPSLDKLKGLSITYRLGEHRVEDFIKADYIFKGPSVSWNLLEIKQALKRNIPVEMEMSFFMDLVPRKKVIGVTGTRGKSTTTMIICQLLKNSGYKVFLGGNIPHTSALSNLDSALKSDWIVLELSSWQLSGFDRKKISPHIAVLTNFFPDHLNYYLSLKEYWQDKKAIFKYQKQGDIFILNKKLKEKVKNEIKNQQCLYFTKNDFVEELKYLSGDHNRENVGAGYQLAKILKLDKKIINKTMANFKGLPYRQEVVADYKGIIFINDTTSTTPIAAEKAIEAFSSNRIVMILGGDSKNLPFQNLIEKLNKVEKIVLLKGRFTKEIYRSLTNRYQEKITLVYDHLDKAIKKAYQIAKQLRKDNQPVVVLFSPSATSFSMFKNEFHRGDEFNRIIKNLIIEGKGDNL